MIKFTIHSLLSANIIGGLGWSILIMKRCLHSLSSPIAFSLKKYDDFHHMINTGKSMARCSLLLEDCTTNHYCLWFEPNESINQRLFDCRAARILRWRVGSNGSIYGGNASKRFMLVQFSDDYQYKEATKYLHLKYRVSMFNQHFLLNDQHFLKRRKEQCNKLKVFLQPNQTQSMNRYCLMSSDGEHFIAEFYDYLRTPTIMGKNIKDSAKKKQTKLINCLLNGEDLVSDFQYQIRFFICHQIESMLRCSEHLLIQSKRVRSCGRYRNNHPNLMNTFELLPFGSDVSGFGNEHSDLDLCFAETKKNFNPTSSINENYQKVRTYRSLRILNSVSNTIESSIKLNMLEMRYFPHLQRIFKAFVPIIKCRSRLMPHLNIDISVDTDCNSGINMADYLYYCSYRSKHSHTIRAFVLLLKAWAKHHKIIHSNPGDWFSSFQMTILAIGFLQHYRLVPSINEWKKLKRKSLSALQDEEKLDLASNNQMEEEIRRLFQGFFQFMIRYDFWNCAMNIETGEIVVKPQTPKTSVCFVINPFIQHLNITKAVSETELERFLSFCKQSLDIVQRQDFHLINLFVMINDRLSSLSSY